MTMPVNLDIASRETGYIGRCLAFVRGCLGIGPKYATALSAWKHAEHQHPGDADPPTGVPVYWSAAKAGPFKGAGHVALSLGHGLVRSTAWPKSGRIGTVSIDDLTRAWGRTYLGWSEDLNGVRVYSAPAPRPVAPAAAPVTIHPEDLMRFVVAAQLNASGGRDYYLITPEGVRYIGDPAVLPDLSQLYGPAVPLDRAQITRLTNLLRRSA